MSANNVKKLTSKEKQSIFIEKYQYYLKRENKNGTECYITVVKHQQQYEHHLIV